MSPRPREKWTSQYIDPREYSMRPKPGSFCFGCGEGRHFLLKETDRRREENNSDDYFHQGIKNDSYEIGNNNHYDESYYRGFCEHTHNFHLPYGYFGKKYMYICARCLGLYGGLVLWFLLLIFYAPLIIWLQSLNAIIILGLCFLLTLPLVIDWWLQCKAIKHSSNLIRLVTGLLASLGVVIMLLSYQAYWLTGPIGVGGFLIVTKVGSRWRGNRTPDWGCSACRHELPHAIPLETKEST